MRITNVTFTVHRAANGSARVDIQHGGTYLSIDMSAAERAELGRLLLEPLFECVPAAAPRHPSPAEAIAVATGARLNR